MNQLYYGNRRDEEPLLLLPVSPTPSMLGRYSFLERRLPLFMDPIRGSRQPDLIADVLNRPPVFEIIFSCLSPAQLHRFARTSLLACNAVSFFFKRAFNVNKHLLRFVSDPIGFRSLQARTGTLISGSNALQFLDRTFFPESDLDLYTHPGHAREVGLWLIHREGYVFLPTQGTNDFDSLDLSSWTPWAMSYPRTDIKWRDLHVRDYRFAGIDEVYQFEKTIPGGPTLRLQIIAAKLNPLQCIFGFHSTCVMNFIAHDAAYSLYPQATFEDHSSLCFAKLRERDIRCLAKYGMRGWRTVSTIWMHERRNHALFHVDLHRFVGDGKCWVVPLDMTGMEQRPALNPVSERFVWDPVRYNSWVLKRQKKEMYISYHVLKPTLFRYSYLFADFAILDNMMEFLRTHGRFEHEKIALVPNDHKATAWSWWDAVVPEYVMDYLQRFDVEDMEMTENEYY